MRCAALALIPLFVLACDRAPVAPAVDPIPSLDASDDHRAGLVFYRDATWWLFDGEGNLGPVLGCDGLDIFTNSQTGRVNSTGHCTVPNPTGRAVRFTQDENPLGPIQCYIVSPDGELVILPKLVQQISASGQSAVLCWGP